MSTKAVASPDGSSFKIDGAKMWITNGTVDGISTGDAFLVYARTGPGRQDISMFLVEKASRMQHSTSLRLELDFLIILCVGVVLYLYLTFCRWVSTC